MIAKMKVLAYIMLLQMIDARNFAKAKRNIFKIQLKREPRRKRKTVSYELKLNLHALRRFFVPHRTIFAFRFFDGNKIE